MYILEYMIGYRQIQQHKGKSFKCIILHAIGTQQPLGAALGRHVTLKYEAMSPLYTLYSALFFSVMLLYSFPCMVVRLIDWVIFLLRFTLSLTPVLIFALFFIWRLIWGILNHLGSSLMGHVSLLSFLDDNRQHRPVCAKTISSWVRKVLCAAKGPISLGSL